MLQLYKKDSLGQSNHGWLQSRFHFSFADYYNPKRIHFGPLRVLNDDLIAAGEGFQPHPHKDMEIITYVRQGTIIHRDSLGNEGRTSAGDVQVMSAGTGITHAEFSDPGKETKLFQIWILPREKGVQPRWDQAQFPKEPVDGQELNLLASGRKEDEGERALYIHQEAGIYGGRIKADSQTYHNMRGDRAYVVMSSGKAVVSGTIMKEGDGAEITGREKISVRALEDSEVLVIDL